MQHRLFDGRHVTKDLVFGLLLLVTICVVMETMSRARWLDAWEDWYYDAWHQLAGVRYPAENVVLVVVDDQTRLAHRDEPLVFWGPHFARAIRVARKAGAKVVGVDYLFSVSAESWLKRLHLPEAKESRTYDAPLREQLASGQVVLAANMIGDEHGKRRVVLPLGDYWGVLPGRLDDVGLTNFYSDPDGAVRHFVPALPDSEGDVWVTLAQSLAERSADREPVNPSPSMQSISYIGPPGSVPRLSFSRLLDPEAEADPQVQDLKGKVVIIGSEFSGQQDKVFTPYSRSLLGVRGHMMTGAEVHANIVETLLTGRTVRPVPAAYQFMYLFVVLAIGTVLFFILPPLRGVAVSAALGLSATAPAFLLFRSSWILAVAGVQLGLALAFLGALGMRIVSGQKERERMRQVFGRYVSDEVVEKLLISGWQPDLGGEALQVTVLFSDIRGFTTIAELLSPHELVEMLNTYFGRVCEPILEQGGSVDKFIGDAVMAVFGSPAPHPDHARRAIRAALSMAATAREFGTWMKQRFADRDLPDFRIGIGLHTGQVVAGNLGSPKRMEFTSIGDTVNTASRLEGLTKELEWAVAASRAAIEAAGPGVITGRWEEVKVRGRKASLEILEVIGMDSQ